MAKGENKYLITYKNLISVFKKDNIPNNILISVREKILADDLIKIICVNFAGKNFSSRDNLIIYNAEDKNIESAINECSNSGLFTEKKIVILRNVKKLLKDAKLALLSYLNNPNPDTCLVMLSPDEKFEVEKIFLFDPKDATEQTKDHKNIVEKSVKIFQVGAFSEAETISWIKEKFEDYKISDDTVQHFLQFSNYGLDEILSEIEKLKTFCYLTKEVSKDSVNLCNGISKDFNEMDFIKAIIGRQREQALNIYNRISLRKDVEVFLVFLLNSAFITINKLFDPGVSKLQGWQLKKELKLWFEDQEKFLPYYKNYKDSIGQEKVIKAFEYIYKTDKILKSSGADKQTTMTLLIDNICSL